MRYLVTKNYSDPFSTASPVTPFAEGEPYHYIVQQCSEMVHYIHRYVQQYIVPFLCLVALVNNATIALVSLAPRAGASYRRAIFPTVRRVCLVLAAADAGAVLFYHTLAWFGADSLSFKLIKYT